MATFACAATDLLQLKQQPSTKRKLSEVENSPTAVTMEPSTLSTTLVEDEGGADAAVKKRLQYKMYQRRHRARQREKARLLEEQVTQLKQEIATLEKTREAALQSASKASEPSDSSFSTRHTLAGPPALLVREYLRLFEHGYSPQKSSAQQAFARSKMAEDVRGHQFTGIQDVLEQWRLYSQVFAAVHLTDQGLKVEAIDQQQTAVTASITLRLRLRRVGLLSLLPSVYRCDGVLDKLVGNSLVVEGSLRFVVDAANRVRWLGTEMDFVDALTRLTGSFESTCLCLDDARLDISTGHIKSSGRMSGPAVGNQDASVASRLDLSFILSDP